MRHNSRLHRYGCNASPSKPRFCSSKSQIYLLSSNCSKEKENSGELDTIAKAQERARNSQFCSFDAFCARFGRRPAPRFDRCSERHSRTSNAFLEDDSRDLNRTECRPADRSPVFPNSQVSSSSAETQDGARPSTRFRLKSRTRPPQQQVGDAGTVESG
jgi:hypothetical protein